MSNSPIAEVVYGQILEDGDTPLEDLLPPNGPLDYTFAGSAEWGESYPVVYVRGCRAVAYELYEELGDNPDGVGVLPHVDPVDAVNAKKLWRYLGLGGEPEFGWVLVASYG